MRAGILPVALQDAIDAHCRAILDELETRGVPVDSEEQLVQVAKQAACGDGALCGS
jgi:hypothetical protein